MLSNYDLIVIDGEDNFGDSTWSAPLCFERAQCFINHGIIIVDDSFLKNNQKRSIVVLMLKKRRPEQTFIFIKSKSA